jgi:hypothetical protein
VRLIMKLYDVPRRTWVIPTEDTTAPPEARPVSVGEPVYFHHIDGAYSYCVDVHGSTVFLPAWQEVAITEAPGNERLSG